MLGKVKKVLASKVLEPLEANYVGVELCETVHLHVPGFRWELTLPRMEKLSEILCRAVQNHKKMGSPKPDGDSFILLADGYLPGEPVYNTRFEIEEQVVPSIHIHIRGLSIRKQIPEFVDFAKVICDASKNLTT